MTTEEETSKHNAKIRFIKLFIEFGFKDHNTGFDVKGISYFSLEDFYKILDRCKEMDVGIFGIEPWPNGEYGDCRTMEEYNASSRDSRWWHQAIDEMIGKGIDHNFSCSYDIPEEKYWPLKQ